MVDRAASRVSRPYWVVDPLRGKVPLPYHILRVSQRVRIRPHMRGQRLQTLQLLRALLADCLPTLQRRQLSFDVFILACECFNQLVTKSVKRLELVNLPHALPHQLLLFSKLTLFVGQLSPESLLDIRRSGLLLDELDFKPATLLYR